MMMGKKNQYQVGELSLNADLKTVRLGEQQLELSPTSFELLACLMARSPALVSVDELLDNVWKPKVVSRDTVKKQIKVLRNQLGSAAETVQSKRGFGYQVLAVQTPKSNWFDRASTKAWVVALLVLSLVLLWFQSTPSPKIQLPLKTAVMPFKALNTQNQVLVDLLQDDLTQMMANQEQVNVVASSAVAHAERQAYGLDDYAKKLGVDLLFEGSLREDEAGYRVNVRMVWTKNSVAVWREQFHTNNKDVNQLINQVKIRIAQLIQKKVKRLQQRV